MLHGKGIIKKIGKSEGGEGAPTIALEVDIPTLREGCAGILIELGRWVDK